MNRYTDSFCFPGDFCIVTPIEEGNKVRAEIKTILLKDQIKYFRENNRWPTEFDIKKDCDIAENDNEYDIEPNMNRQYFDDEEDESEEDSYEDEDEEDNEKRDKDNSNDANSHPSNLI